MIKYTPKELPENVNVPKVSALREFFVLMGGVVGIVLGLFLLLGLLVDLMVTHMSPATERKIEGQLGPMFVNLFSNSTENAAAEVALQGIVDKMLQGSGQTQRVFQVHLVTTSDINAMAVPGGHIFVFSGLVTEAQSENELAMVLGHEVGHFAHRDHLRAMGRGLVLLTLSTVLLGGDDSVSGFLQRMMVHAELKHSRGQELAADEWGLDLVDKRYGHVGGSLDFFRRMSDKEKHPRWSSFLLTHPLPEKRIKEMESQIQRKGYRVGETLPLPPALKELAGKKKE